MTDTISSKTVPELKQMLQQQNLPTSGNKPALIKRLLGFLSTNSASQNQASGDQNPKGPNSQTQNAETIEEGEIPQKGRNFNAQISQSANPSKASWQERLNARARRFNLVPGTVNGRGHIHETMAQTEAEKIAQRRQRFGITAMPMQKRLDARRQRFGQPYKPPFMHAAKPAPRLPHLDATELEKRRLRAQRFGLA
ncbi:bifunctional SAP domain/SAP domain superfamily [Babesia duncani]|uniref:Bifunctional SAP domain/SAP domain superfamily n=1 Tax=Babesia duncani TaxID=323732 RepID=A0AAD9PN50_9APIC|nr:bifunctional SAP domain/SAP domain superfamily [Babesia duncani]